MFIHKKSCFTLIFMLRLYVHVCDPIKGHKGQRSFPIHARYSNLCLTFGQTVRKLLSVYLTVETCIAQIIPVHI